MTWQFALGEVDCSESVLTECEYSEETGHAPQEERWLKGVICQKDSSHGSFDRRTKELRNGYGCPKCLGNNPMSKPEKIAAEAIEEFGAGQLENLYYEPTKPNLAVTFGKPLHVFCAASDTHSLLTGTQTAHRQNRCEGPRRPVWAQVHEARPYCRPLGARPAASFARRGGWGVSLLPVVVLSRRRRGMAAPEGVCVLWVWQLWLLTRMRARSGKRSPLP